MNEVQYSPKNSFIISFSFGDHPIVPPASLAPVPGTSASGYRFRSVASWAVRISQGLASTIRPWYPLPAAQATASPRQLSLGQTRSFGAEWWWNQWHLSKACGWERVAFFLKPYSCSGHLLNSGGLVWRFAGLSKCTRLQLRFVGSGMSHFHAYLPGPLPTVPTAPRVLRFFGPRRAAPGSQE